MPEDDEDIVGYFTVWIYCGRLEAAIPLYNLRDIDLIYSLALLRLVKFADKIRCPSLTRDAINAFQYSIFAERSLDRRGVIDSALTNFVWSEIPDELPLRELIIMVFVHFQSNGHQIEWQLHPLGLLAEVAKRFKTEATVAPEPEAWLSIPTNGSKVPREMELVDSLLRSSAVCPRCHNHRNDDHDIALFQGKLCKSCTSFTKCCGGRHFSFIFPHSSPLKEAPSATA